MNKRPKWKKKEKMKIDDAKDKFDLLDHCLMEINLEIKSSKANMEEEDLKEVNCFT